MSETAIKWRRHEAGAYSTTIDGVQYVIVNTHGMDVGHSGLGAWWHVKRGDGGAWWEAHGTLHRAYSFADAKKWVQAQVEDNEDL